MLVILKYKKKKQKIPTLFLFSKTIMIIDTPEDKEFTRKPLGDLRD